MHPPREGELWDRLTDPIMLLVQRVRIAGPVVGNKVPVQTERVSGKLGPVRMVPLSRFAETTDHGKFARVRKER